MFVCSCIPIRNSGDDDDDETIVLFSLPKDRPLTISDLRKYCFECKNICIPFCPFYH